MRINCLGQILLTFFLLSLGAARLEGQGTPATTQTLAHCSSFRGQRISADRFGLPTGGATITSASEKGDGITRYCKVRGNIVSTDPQVEAIHFEVNLPYAWNRKAVQYGGAVFDGSITYSDGIKRPTIGRKDIPTPLQSGYATFGGDSGHQSQHIWMPNILSIFNATFASNSEQRQNFATDSLKKTHDAAMELMRRIYGSDPQRMFFLGSSSGGHEALVVVQKWPTEYDGVMSGYPSWDGMEMVLQFARTSQALYRPGGFLPKASTKLLSRQVLATCDKADGLADGLVSNVDGCHFDPSTLLCSVQETKGCLTDQQLNTVKIFATEQRTSFAGKNNMQSIGGYNVLAGADLTGSLGWFSHPEEHPKVLLNSITYTIASRAFRAGITKDNNYDVLTTDVVNGGPVREELVKTSERYDASDADLSRFAAHGGKLLLIHGTADAIIPTDSSVMYYKRVQATMGTRPTDDFMRFYLIPGFGHGTGTFLAGVDALGILDRWNGTGQLPNDLVAIDKRKKHHGRTRPLCSYPTWPKFNGTGDGTKSSDFTCTE